MKGSPAAAEPSLRHELAFAWLHLGVLWAFAFAKPLFDVLQDGPEFFVARGNSSADIIVLAFAVMLLPPTLLVACEAAVSPFRSFRRGLHLAFVGLLVAAIALQAIKGWDASGAVLIAISVAVGAAGALAYARTQVAPGVLSVLSPAPIVFLAIFLLFSPVSKLVLPQDDKAAASSNVESHTPVVMLVLDEFSGSSLADRTGKIDASRFPHFAALSRDSTWYRNATTVADVTSRAVPALLTGLRPIKGRLPTSSGYPKNLFTMLGSSHSLNVEEPATDLCTSELCGHQARPPVGRRMRALFDDLTVVSGHMLLPKDLEDNLPAVDRTFGGFRNSGRDVASIPGAAFENRIGQFNRFLGNIRRPTRKPALDFQHLEIPHTPWQYLPTGQTYPVSGPDIPGLSAEHWSTQAAFPKQAYQRYLLQVGFVDRLLGRLTRRLREQGLYDRALIVVTADHGVSFRADQSRRIVVSQNIPEIANVPLFVKAPRQRAGRVNDGPARTIDVLPTIAHTVGLPLQGRVDGRPLPRRGSADSQVMVNSYKGDEERISFRDFVRRRDDEVTRRIGLFGADDGFVGVFAARSGRGLFGKPVAAVSGKASAGVRAELDTPDAYASVSPGGHEVPAFVTGRLRGTALGDETVSVAINGRVAAVAQSYTDGKEVRFGALVPSASFRKGANRVQAFAVSAADSATQFSGGALEKARLVRRGGGLVVTPPRGRPIRVTSGAADGAIELIRGRSRGVVVIGWAMDSAHRHRVDDVLLFGDGRPIAAALRRIPRPDLVKRFSRGAAQAGYIFAGARIPASIVKPKRLRVVAIVDGRASELKPASSRIFPKPS